MTIRLFMLGVVALWLSACTSSRLAVVNDLPDDFALSITVLPQPKPAPGVKDAHPPALEPAWYMVDSADVLRIALGERLPNSPLPTSVRTLSRPQVRRLWEVAAAAGLTLEPPAERVVGGDVVSVDHALAIVDVSEQGHRRSFSVRPEQGEQARAVTDLVAQMRALGWIKPGA